MYSEKKRKRKTESEKQRDYKKNKLFRRIKADIKDRDRRRTPGIGQTIKKKAFRRKFGKLSDIFRKVLSIEPIKKDSK